ncbi:AAA family ATPase [Parachitinimonas caeni]|uniref:ATP-binding protein n=1 Tax=Parachitinimonas caeni TaxID=3031301 RepID=A0ABT7DV67_9NEIS|nr:ATP-binding protein [Parachitinimonas caeni]MDK2123962.1 ATP-binding protein [Parachitinimonas caeni]
MRITNLKVFGFMNRTPPLEIKFQNDLNIITGRNGSGKTSLLKLIWYISSGNILMALREIDFKEATLETTEYECKITRQSSQTCKILLSHNGKTEEFSDKYDQEGNVTDNAEDFVDTILQEIGSSIFFPTFRRIEGGFGLTTSNTRLSRARIELEESLSSLTHQLSSKKHKLISALSTSDIVNLIAQQYSDLSDEYEKRQKKNSQSIIKLIKDFKKQEKEEQNSTAIDLIEKINESIEKMDQEREEIMKPLSSAKNYALKLVRPSGIKIAKRFCFGDIASAIQSEVLSSGEKQMFSFISYNAFYKDSQIFIDEPELSLHADWQRQLFTTLANQESSNQFIVSTHSPFIYSKYPDKEIQIESSRGDEEL